MSMEIVEHQSSLRIIETERVQSIRAACYGGGGYWLYPTYAVIDGVEHFMFNRREDSNGHVERAWEYEEWKKQLVATEGKYFKFYGFMDDPIAFLNMVATEGYHFDVRMEEDYIFSEAEDVKCYEFQGNLKEVSAAFHYRIYDTALAKKIAVAVHNLFAGRYENIWEEV